ncbi:hypothetical protein C0993_001034 [Termitomyces sp. T159_Od127]|nr:hypothetical protein C0993_001034 [Termitomyces sp. T159_Od127]
MVRGIALCFERLFWVHIRSPSEGVELGAKGVALKDDGEGGVEVVEDGSGGEGFLEEGEYTLAPAVPVPRGVLPCEPVEGFGDLGVVINELAVEIGKTKEGLHLVYTLGWRSVEDGFHLSGVHVNAIWSDYDAKVLDFSGVEQALLRLGVEVVLLELFEDVADVVVVLFQ